MTEALLPRIAQGDRAAVDELIARYGSLVWHFARQFTDNHADAEDAVQEIFVKLWSNAEKFQPALASESTFIAMIARRFLIDRWRKSRQTPAVESLDEHFEELPQASSDRADTSEEASQVARCWTRLLPAEQKVLTLAVEHGQTHGQIAEFLRLPIGTVKSHSRRGLMKLREWLGPVTMGRSE